MDKQKAGAIAGLGLAAIVGYYLYAGGQEEETTIGGSGSFSGLGGSEGLLTGQDTKVAGTSDSGINYNINLPEIDTSGLQNILNEPISGSQNVPLSPTKDPSIATSKKEAVTPSTTQVTKSSGGFLDSLSSSLGQVFGTQAQRTNERGDYITTAAGGGAGEIKGESLGTQFLNLLSGKTASGEKTVSALPTGASTASSNLGVSEAIQAIKANEGSKSSSSSKKASVGSDSRYVGKTYKSSDIVSRIKSNSSSSSKKSGSTVSLSEAKKGSSRFSSQPSSGTGKVKKIR